jgi:hypothetical protein
MPNAIRNYLHELGGAFGSGWNRFWFSPVSAAPLSLVRLIIGLISIWWYVSYYADLQFYFGPEGIIGPETIAQWRGNNLAFSIFDWSATATGLWFTYGLGLVIVVLYTVGLFSRVSSVAAFIVVISLIHRGPMLAHAMEDLMATVMLYTCLGPSGARFSLDRVWKNRNQPSTRAAAEPVSIGANIALRLIQIHLALYHFGMAIGQLRDDTWWMGRALWGFIGKPESGYIDLTFLADHLFLLNLWTHGVVIFEFAFALLIWNRRARPILLTAAVLVWVSVGLVSGMLGFAAVMLTATVAFVPPEWLARK